jgi:hypothetical protein
LIATRSSPAGPKRFSAASDGEYQKPGSARLRPQSQTEAALDLQNAPLGVRSDVAKSLEVQLAGSPLVRKQGLAVGVDGLRSRHEVDGQIQSDDEVVGDPVVELKRPLK